jgi:hypothetical protein
MLPHAPAFCHSDCAYFTCAILGGAWAAAGALSSAPALGIEMSGLPYVSRSLIMCVAQMPLRSAEKAHSIVG